MNHCEQVLFHMNWDLLREQKDYCLNEAENAPDITHIYQGIVHLIDAIQDAAILDRIATEEEVFGSSPDEEGIDDE